MALGCHAETNGGENSMNVTDHKLKECPFCGKIPSGLQRMKDRKEVYRIWCIECNFESKNFTTQDEAVEWWNKRK